MKAYAVRQLFSAFSVAGTYLYIKSQKMHMNAQLNREETPQHDTSLFLKFQLRTDKPEAERLELAGVRRIMIELEGKPEVKEFCRRYSNLVDSISDILKEDLKIQPHEEQRFITEVWGIIKGNLNIKKGENRFGFLWESLETKKWDCDNSSFLVFDVAKKLEINAKMASLPGHVLIVTDNFYFETAKGKPKSACYHPIDELKTAYPVVYGITSDVEVIQSITYFTLGNAYRAQGLYEKAISHYTKARDRNPRYADAYNNQGIAHYEQGFAHYKQGFYTEAVADYREALADLTKAMDLGLKYAWVHNNRGNVYFELGLYEEAEADHRDAIELDREYADAYYNRGVDRLMLGKEKEANEDFKIADRLRLAARSQA